MDIYGINIIAVVLATIGFMAVGFVWYGPLFGKRWMALHGLTEEQIKAGGNMGLTMAKGVANSLVMAIVLALVLGWLGSAGLVQHLIHAFVLWLGFSATTQVLAHIWERQPLELTAINWGNQLAGFLVAGAIISFF